MVVRAHLVALGLAAAGSSQASSEGQRLIPPSIEATCTYEQLREQLTGGPSDDPPGMSKTQTIVSPETELLNAFAFAETGARVGTPSANFDEEPMLCVDYAYTLLDIAYGEEGYGPEAKAEYVVAAREAGVLGPHGTFEDLGFPHVCLATIPWKGRSSLCKPPYSYYPFGTTVVDSYYARGGGEYVKAVFDEVGAPSVEPCICRDAWTTRGASFVDDLCPSQALSGCPLEPCSPYPFGPGLAAPPPNDNSWCVTKEVEVEGETSRLCQENMYEQYGLAPISPCKRPPSQLPGCGCEIFRNGLTLNISAIGRDQACAIRTIHGPTGAERSFCSPTFAPMIPGITTGCPSDHERCIVEYIQVPELIPGCTCVNAGGMLFNGASPSQDGLCQINKKLESGYGGRPVCYKRNYQINKRNGVADLYGCPANTFLCQVYSPPSAPPAAPPEDHGDGDGGNNIIIPGNDNPFFQLPFSASETVEMKAGVEDPPVKKVIDGQVGKDFAPFS